MALKNKVIVTGRITQPPELRYTQNETAYCFLNLAVQREFKNDNNEREADFPQGIISYRNIAENIANYAGKGDLVQVEAVIRTYKDNENKTRENKVIVSWELLQKKGSGNGGNNAPPPEDPPEAQGPQNNKGQNNEQGGGNEDDWPTPDDIPF